MSGPGSVRRGLQPTFVDLDQLGRRFGCDVTALPRGVVVIGWDPDARTFLASRPPDRVTSARLATLLAFLLGLGGRLRSQAWWSLVCLDDAWPEGVPFIGAARLADRTWQPGQALEPGLTPRLSARQPHVLAFGRHRGDASVVLLPDTHYLFSLAYLKARALLPLEDRAWRRKLPSAIYCGGQHGSPHSFEGHLSAGTETPRERLARLAADLAAPLEVHLGGAVSRSRQLRHRMVLDVDGYARTWDAWAWKLRSRSVTLSQSSVWESFFSTEFQAWAHFVPVANDLSDLQKRISWCLQHDEEAHALAKRARRRAREVYAYAAVRDRTRLAVEQVVLPATGIARTPQAQ